MSSERASPGPTAPAGPEGAIATTEESAGDRLARLLGVHQAGLSRVALAYTGSAADRDDLLQEIAVALLGALPAFRGECSERTFVYRVAHNRGATFAARRAARTRLLNPAADPDATLGDQPSPEESAAQRQASQRLWRAIRALPVAQRAVLVLALEDLPQAEIGAVLGITANHVAVRLKRARDALRAELSKGGVR